MEAQRDLQGATEMAQTTEEVALKDVSEDLLEVLRRAGDEWGPLGVARVAARLANRELKTEMREMSIERQLVRETAQFDLEAFRAKLEEQISDYYSHEDMTNRANESAVNIFSWVLDQLPPKPQPTAEEIISRHRIIWPDDGLPERCSCGHQFKIGDSIARHQIEPLRAAGLLREDT